MTALGLVIHVLSGGAVDLNTAILSAPASSLVYTIFGGMWSVALTDLFQTVVILVGLTLVAFLVGDMAGGAGKVIAQAAADGKFDSSPRPATRPRGGRWPARSSRSPSARFRSRTCSSA